MAILYNIFIYLYHFLIALLSPFNKKAGFRRKGLIKWQEKLEEQRTSGSRYLWFHCASLGEFEQGRPVIEEIRKEFPEYKTVLTFFSSSGYEIRKNYSHADIIGYLPADTPRNARKFTGIIRPEMAFFIKYEFWYNYIAEMNKRGIPLYLLSARFRKGQVFFSPMPWGKWFRNMLTLFHHFFLQDQDSASLLTQAGLTNFTISGDTRFDRVASIAESSQTLPVVEKFLVGKSILVAGSTWKPDEELLVPFINEQQGMKFIIVPHEVTPSNVNRLLKLLKRPVVLYSKADEADAGEYDVLVVDSVGLLSSIYRYGTYAYIGGGFGAGIHNILEAATFGMPLFFGPNYHKFMEACQLVKLGAAFPVTSAGQFREQLLCLAENPQKVEEISQTASRYVQNHRGATRKVIRQVFK